MKMCVNHPEKEALGVCAECGDPVCPICAVFVKELMCRKCAAVMLFPDEKKAEEKKGA